MGYVYSIEATKKLERDGVACVGICDNRNLHILLEKDCTPQMTRSTLLHEILEALKERLRLKLSHDTIDQLEAGLDAVLVDNPEFVRMYLEKKT